MGLSQKGISEMNARKQLLLCTTVVGLALVIAGCPLVSAIDAVEQLNKALIQQFYDDVWNAHDPDANANFFDHPNAVHHDPPAADYQPTAEQAVQRLEAALMIVPDVVYTVHELIAKGDKVVARWTATGTHTGDINGVPATGNTVTVSGTTIYRLSGGKIVESWNAQDNLHLQEQFGAITITNN
jgi:steroid delta-isomerase-like uncharacterized protein